MNELSAIEAYQGTLGAKEWKLGDGDPEIDELFHILVDHVQAASLLGRTLGRLKRMPLVSELNHRASGPSSAHWRVDCFAMPMYLAIRRG